MNITKAILSLRPGATWSLNGNTYDGLKWLDETQTQPTKEEVLAEMEKLQKIVDSYRYQRDRASEYPSIQEQLDTLYHQGYDGWKASIDEVKNKYPKPE
jgi:hypothetical protein